MEEFLRVGVVTSSHALAGEVKVYPTTDDPQRFRMLKEVYADTRKGMRRLVVDHVRFFRQFVIVHFEGLDRIEDVQELLKCDLLVTRENALPLAEGQYFLADLIGLQVQEEDGTVLGVLEDILQTGANDVYAVRMKDTGKELLIPAIAQCIRSIKPEQGFMVVHLLPGLEPA